MNYFFSFLNCRYASEVANCGDEDAPALLDRILQKEGTADARNLKPLVCVGRDTRSSSPRLALLVHNALCCFDAALLDAGLVTTPQLHYIVRALNTAYTTSPYGVPSEEGYLNKLVRAFERLLALRGPRCRPAGALHVDCANGIGGRKLCLLRDRLAHLLELRVFNDGLTSYRAGKLNERCGADFVKIMQTFPVLYGDTSELGAEAIVAGDRWASLDGDADRLVYFYRDAGGAFHLLDGDKIAILLTSVLCSLLERMKLPSDLKLRVGLVQTAYANGSSTRYLRERFPALELSCVPTGVKHLHAKAHELDMGVYFEANGHGTILFSDRLKRVLKDRLPNASRANATGSEFAAMFLELIELTNEAVGDALADMLLVEAALVLRAESAVLAAGESSGAPSTNAVLAWDAQYTDLPSRQLKVKVRDRSSVRTTDAERRVVQPPALQEGVDRLLAATQDASARAFVRPSGTEDIVRVYAEATTSAAADRLANDIAQLITSLGI